MLEQGPKPQTLNPKPQTLNPKPQTLKQASLFVTVPCTLVVFSLVCADLVFGLVIFSMGTLHTAAEA